MNKKGFTLIELLVVISIIGLLSTLAVIALGNAREKSRDARRVSDIKQIQTAMELYYNDQNQYPTGASIVLGGANATCLGSTSGFAASSTACTGTIYMKSVPANPSPGGAAYTYTATVVGGQNTNYGLDYELESGAGGITSGPHTASSGGIQ